MAGNGRVNVPTGGIMTADPPSPSDPPASTLPTFRQTTRPLDNHSAEDLHDHWNDSSVLQQAVGTTRFGDQRAAARIETLDAILNASTDPPLPSPTLLQNVPGRTIAVIGEHRGFTYGQWKQGSAGTLNIEFDWSFAPELGAGTRAQMERAGKLWSRRLGDDFGTHRIAAGRRISRSQTIDTGIELDELRLSEAVTASDLVIFVDRHDGTRRSSGNWSVSGPDAFRRNDFEPVLGAVRLGQHRFDEADVRGNLGLFGVMVHEIGHVLGIATLQGRPFYDVLVDEQAGTFNGRAALEANNGEPVSFQRLDEQGRAVAPGTPGGAVDWGHLAPCTSVMSYCRDAYNVYAPSELDFAFLADIGYEVLDPSTQEEPEVFGWGAWGRYSAWGAGVERTIRYKEDIRGSIRNLIIDDSLGAGADAFGIAPDAPLRDLYESGPQGSATWSGSLIGVDIGSPHLPPVFGDAEINVALHDLEGTARFDGLVVVTAGEAGVFRAPSLEYAVRVTDNAFTDPGGRIHGNFFGPGHEEVAGVLHDPSPDVGLLAGFGGARQSGLTGSQ